MDAFAVSICKGVTCRGKYTKTGLVCGAWFGGFQGLMPFAGFLLGSAFRKYITPIDHWIAFALLGLLGLNMIKAAFSPDGEPADSSLGFRVMLAMAVATSVDALAVGITFALLPEVNILLAVGSIGVITFILSAVGVRVGSVFGAKNKKYAEIAGGIVLFLIGLKILLEHLEIVRF
jgi:putative Mn2+ efflux pump MntP